MTCFGKTDKLSFGPGKGGLMVFFKPTLFEERRMVGAGALGDPSSEEDSEIPSSKSILSNRGSICIVVC